MSRIFGYLIGVIWIGFTFMALGARAAGAEAGQPDVTFWWTVIGAVYALAATVAIVGPSGTGRRGRQGPRQGARPEGLRPARKAGPSPHAPSASLEDPLRRPELPGPRPGAGERASGRAPLLLQAPSALIADGDAPLLPRDFGRVDFEGEVAFVVGRHAAGWVPASEGWAALSHVLPMNDVTARDLQRTDGQWTRAKGFDTFAPPAPRCPSTNSAARGLDPARLRWKPGSTGRSASPGASTISSFRCRSSWPGSPGS
jgi:hypothetical protein